MTADQLAADAFDREWQHALAGLPPRPCLSDHAAVLKHRRSELSIQELLQYYSKKLPAYLYGPLLLKAGGQLQGRQDFRLAAELCFKQLADLNLPATAGGSCRRLDADGRLSLHVQALYGLHACQAAEAMLQDSHLQHQHTVTAVMSALAGLQEACQMAVPEQPILVHAGTQHIHKLATQLLAAGLHVQVLHHLLFAARAMESHISLSSVHLLPWRVQLYAAAAECFFALTSWKSTSPEAASGTEAHIAPGQGSSSSTDAATVDEAADVLTAGLLQITSIARAQALDAVPAPDVTAAVQAAQAQLRLLQTLFEQGPTAAAGAATPAGAAQVLASIKAVGSQQEQLAALLRLLQTGLSAHSSLLQRTQLPTNLQPAMSAAAELAVSALGLASPDAGLETAAAQPSTACAKLHQDLICVAFGYQQQELLHKLLATALTNGLRPQDPDTPGSSVAGCSNSLLATAAVLDAVARLHQSPGESAMQHLAAVLVQHSQVLSSGSASLLATAALQLHAAASPMLQGCFSLTDSNAELVQQLLEGLHVALQHSGHVDGVLRGSVALRLAAVLEEQQQLDRGLDVVQEGLAAVVTARSDALTHLQGQADEHLRWISGARTQPDDSIAALVEGMSDTEQVLACLHADALLLKSRLVLKQGMHEAASKAASRQQRLQATLQKRDQQADIFGARTRKEHRLDAIAIKSAGQLPQTAPDVEKRLMLECGCCPYQQALVLTATAEAQPDVNRQASLLEEACDALHAAHAAEAELFAAQQPPAAALKPLSAHHVKPNNPKVLRRTPNSISLTAFPVKLAREAGKPATFAAYCKPCAAGVSLTVNKTAMEYPGSGVQVPIASRVTIYGLQACETYKFAVAVFDDQGTLMGELGASSPPIVMTLPLPVYYCYAQVLLVAARLGQWRVAKRAAAVLLPRFFTTTPSRPLWQAHPADRFTLQQQQVATQVAPFLRLLVQAMYAYSGHLAGKQLAGLQAGANSSCAGGEEAALSSNGLAGTAASRALLLSLSQSHLPQQVALLEAAQKHLLAMQVAAQAGDEMLVEEGALRTFNLLLPLLQQQDISPTLFQPLSELHSILAAVQDTAPSSVSGHTQQRQQAAQALATAGFCKLRLLEPVGPDLACGSAAIAAHGVLGLQLKPSAALEALDGALLRVLENKFAAAHVSQEGSSASTKAGGKAGSKKQAGHKGGKKTEGIPEASASVSAVVGVSAGQAHELAALQELLLWHPRGAFWAAELHASRCDDSNDLVAQVLPKLEQAQALTTCWPLLSTPAAHSHPKWLPLCVLLMQAASKQHGAALWLSLPQADKASVSSPPVGLTADSLPEAARAAATPQLVAAATAACELLQAVKQQVRLTARRPQFLTWPSSPKWTVQSAATELEAEGFVLGDQGTAAAVPQPELPAGTSTAASKAAMAAWQKQNADLLIQERRRLASATFLQQRLPVLLGRRMVILAARQQCAAWAPWLAQLHTTVGSMVAEAAAQLLALKVPAVVNPKPLELDAILAVSAEGAAAAAAPAATEATAEPETAGRIAAIAATEATAVNAPPTESFAVPTDATSTPAKLASGPNSKQITPCKGGADSKAQAEGPAPLEAAALSKGDTLETLAQVLVLQAHQQFAQAATLSARSGTQQQQVFSISIQLQRISTYLLNKLQALLTPKPPVAWSIKALPGPLVPPLVAVPPEKPVDPAATAGKADRRSAAVSASGKAAADKKPAGGAAKGMSGRPSAVTPRAEGKHTLLPDKQHLHVAVSLRAVAAALLAALQQVRRQLSPIPPPTADSQTHDQYDAAAGAGQYPVRRYATSFSFGSDSLSEPWHLDSGVDVSGLTHAMAVMLKALHRMEWWRCELELGGAWLELCQGSADQLLVPQLLRAAQQSGPAGDVAALTAAQQTMTADRNVALEELSRVRLLVVERLQGLPPLDAANCSSTTIGCSNSISQSATSWKASAPDHVLLPAEYDKVVAELKKRAEKGHMILALNELGDVHAHFGSWSQAGEAWSTALDALLGPYNVVDTWRHKLDLGSRAELLKRYGVHGLLLAATILGKLARYMYHGDLGSRLSCALLAAELLPAVFAGDITHPQRRLDFAAYVPVQIWPGVDVFDDPYRCNAAALAASLECLTSILQEQQLHLLTLPHLALWEHTSLYVAHNRASTVLARITRVRSLAALGLMPQAAVVLQGLMQGCNLPGLVLGPPQQVLGASSFAAAPAATRHHPGGKGHAVDGKDSKGDKEAAGAGGSGDADSRPLLYHAAKWPEDPTNAAFLQLVAEAVLDPAIAAAYGSWLCGHLTLARAAFLTAAGGAVDGWVDGKPSALAAAVQAGPPPPVDPVAAASVAAAASAGAAAATAGPALAPGVKAEKPPAGAAGSAGAAKAAAAAAAAAAATPPPPARTPAEHKLLAAAVHLLQGVVTTASPASGMSAAVLGLPWADQGAPAEAKPAAVVRGAAGKAGNGSHGSAGKAGHSPSKGGKGSPQKHGKGSTKGTAAQQQQQEPPGGADAAAAERRAAAAAELDAAQHQQLLVEALLQLASVQLLRWQPLLALPVCLAACEAIRHVVGSSCGSLVWLDSPLDGSQAEMKAALQPGSGTWLAARWQLAGILLQLHHHGPCVAVCLKALTDAARAADVVWSARLLRLQAAALAAQEDYLQALDCCRTALTRLEEHSLPSSLVLPLQQDYAALCDEVGARGDFDKLTGAILAASTAAVHDMGLQEMMEHPQLTNIYLPAASSHLTALLQAASAATRRRQLATAEHHLRSAATMLGCCRCLPVHAAAVLTGLARVLRLQTALKLPDTAVLGNTVKSSSPGSDVGTQQPQQQSRLVGVPGASTGGASAGVRLQQRRLHEAAHLLASGLRVLITDAGSHPVLVRAALLELATVLIQAASEATDGTQGSTNAVAAAKVAAVLRAAHLTAGHVCRLYLDCNSLQPVVSPSTSLPDWLVELLKGHEQLQQSIQQQAAAAAAAVAAGPSRKPAGAAGNTVSSSTVVASATTAGKQTSAALVAADVGTAGTGTTAGPATVSDAVLGRLAVSYYVQQLTAMSSGAAGLDQQQRAAEQTRLVQPALRAACAKFAAECCWPEVPIEVATVVQSLAVPVPVPAPALQTGTVMVQWYRQDGCWQAPSSWACHGTLPPTGQLSSDALATLPNQHPCVSCLYVLVMPPATSTAPAASDASLAAAAGTGAAVAETVAAAAAPLVLQGELVVGLERAKRVQLQVSAMHSRLKSPGKPGDMFTKPAPSTAELAAVKHSLECLLAAIAEDDMSSPPADLPPALTLPVPTSSTPAPAAAATAAAAGTKGGPGAAAAAAKPPPSAKSSAAGSTAAVAAAGKASGTAAAAVAPGAGVAGSEGVVVNLEWRQVDTWAKVEMLMDLEGGLQITDAAVALWLGKVLQGNLAATCTAC